MEQTSTNPFEPGRSDRHKNTGLKVAVALLAALLVGLGIVGIKKYKDFQAVETQLEQEKQALINDLEELKINYETALQENSELKDEILQAKTKVESLIAELENVKATDLKIIRKYKQEIYRLQKEKEKLFRVIDSLKQANQILAFQKDSLGEELTQLSETHKKVVEENKKLTETVQKAKTLVATDIKADGVKIKKRGKVMPTRRAKRTEQIRVCAHLPQNPVLEPGMQTVYVQVLNPEGEVIGNKDIIQVNGREQIVSAFKDFRYDGQPMDICIFVIPDSKDRIIKGEYPVILYHNGQKIGETTLLLK